MAAKLNALGPGKCVAVPADLQSVQDIKNLVAELTKRETRKCVIYNRQPILY